MKNHTWTHISIFILTAILSFGFVFALPTDIAFASHRENAIYSRLTDELVELYETDIAHTKIVSNKSAKDIQKLTNKYGFSEKKIKALLLLADLSNRVGETKPFAELANMSDRTIIRFGKHLFDEYGKTLTDDQKKELKSKAINALKSD